MFCIADALSFLKIQGFLFYLMSSEIVSFISFHRADTLMANFLTFSVSKDDDCLSIDVCSVLTDGYFL